MHKTRRFYIYTYVRTKAGKKKTSFNCMYSIKKKSGKCQKNPTRFFSCLSV
jgi:hypothetical protein